MRFKKENMLILALLPGPNEVKLHKINHYLIPIIDELLEFWSGINLPLSKDHLEGKKIWLAVICCANDILVTRKLCGHILAKATCYRCHKRANVVSKKLNFEDLMIYLNGFKIRILKNIVQMLKPGGIVLPKMKEMPIFMLT